MTNYQEKIIDLQTGETTYRDYTPEEIAQAEAAKAALEVEATARAEKEAARAAALAKFEELGFTADEVKLVLGS